MAAKPNEPAKAADAAHAAPAPAAGAAADKEKGADQEASAKPSGGGLTAFIPLIAAIVIAPALSWAIGQFVLMPQLKKQIAAAAPAGAHAAEAAPAAEEAAAPAEKEKGGKEGKGKKGESAANGSTYEFENVVVNLAGTMGTRYLKTAFLVTGTDKSLRAAFETNKPKMVDITINVLSSLSLADLEEAGAKNLIREKMIGAYNQAFGKKLVEQIYFSDFVVQ